MNTPVIRFLFDECYSLGLRDELLQFFSLDYPSFEYHHVLDRYSRSTDDREWLDPLRAKSDWIVVTKDAGRDASAERLPAICRELEITHIGMTPTLIHAGYTPQKLALTAVWSQMPLLLQLPPGTRVRLGCDDSRGIRSYRMRIGQKPLAVFLNELPEIPEKPSFRLES